MRKHRKSSLSDGLPTRRPGVVSPLHPGARLNTPNHEGQGTPAFFADLKMAGRTSSETMSRGPAGTKKNRCREFSTLAFLSEIELVEQRLAQACVVKDAGKVLQLVILR